MAGRLPRVIVIKSNYYFDKGNFYYKQENGYVVLGEPSVFSTLVKIEAERATSNDRYVHLRFGYSNKYWARKENDRFIVAESSKPEEDTSKPSCTLFEPIEVDAANGMFYLNHVQSGGRLLIDDPAQNPTMAFYVNLNPGKEQGYLRYVNWDTLVKLPAHVAFKGDNDLYLKAYSDKYNFLQFGSEDANDRLSGHRVNLMPDGHVRIVSDHFGRFWRRSPNWIWGDSTDTTANNRDTLFWPVKIDDHTIALRNAGNDHFCKRLSLDGKVSCLNASDPTITIFSRMQVQELVLGRRIYHVRYFMENARIYGETPFLAGTTTVINNGDTEGSIAVAITYQNETSYSFNRSLSLTAGVTTTIEAGVPLITSASIEVSYQINTTLEWGTTTTTTTSVTATGAVPVPPKSTAVVSYVGTMGTCSIPFQYTQQDRSSTDGSITETDQIDGLYTGVNCYNFNFVVERTKSL